jgi:hypothetical protein
MSWLKEISSAAWELDRAMKMRAIDVGLFLGIMTCSGSD